MVDIVFDGMPNGSRSRPFLGVTALQEIHSCRKIWIGIERFCGSAPWRPIAVICVTYSSKPLARCMNSRTAQPCVWSPRLLASRFRPLSFASRADILILACAITVSGEFHWSVAARPWARSYSLGVAIRYRTPTISKCSTAWWLRPLTLAERGACERFGARRAASVGFATKSRWTVTPL